MVCDQTHSQYLMLVCDGCNQNVCHVIIFYLFRHFVIQPYLMLEFLEIIGIVYSAELADLITVDKEDNNELIHFSD